MCCHSVREKSQNHGIVKSLKSPVKPLIPIISPALPSPPLNHVPKCYIHTAFKSLQEWWLQHILLSDNKSHECWKNAVLSFYLLEICSAITEENGAILKHELFHVLILMTLSKLRKVRALQLAYPLWNWEYRHRNQDWEVPHEKLGFLTQQKLQNSAWFLHLSVF